MILGMGRNANTPLGVSIHAIKYRSLLYYADYLAFLALGNKD